MAGLVELARPTIEAEPGDEAEVGVFVYNTGLEDEVFHLEVLGPVGPWARFARSSVAVDGGGSAEVLLSIRPPRSPDVPAGPTHFTVRLTHESRPDLEELATATVDVGAYEAFAARVVPEVIEAGVVAHPRVEIRNEGNVPMVVSLDVVSDDAALLLDIEEPTIMVGAGSIETTRLRARPVKRRLVGKGDGHAYTVVLESVGQTAKLRGHVTPTGALGGYIARGIGVLILLALLLTGGLWVGGAFDHQVVVAASTPRVTVAPSLRGLDPNLSNAPTTPEAPPAAPTTLPGTAPVTVAAVGPAPSIGTIDQAPPGPQTGGPTRPLVLHRFYDPALVDYTYAADDAEVATFTSSGFTDQGTVGKLWSARVANTVPLYRLRSATGQHTVTFDEAERKSLKARGYRDEAVVGYIFPGPTAGTLAVYRLIRGDSAYLTTDQADAAAKVSNGFTSQGVRGYVLA